MNPSPFSLDNGYSLFWQTVPPGWRADPDAALSLTERDEKILETLANLRLATSLQLLKPFFPDNLKTAGKERLKKLYQKGALVLHLLECPRRRVSMVTPGPLAARVADHGWDPAWHRNLDLAAVLRHLVAVELCLAFRRVLPTRFFPAPGPFQAVLAVGERGTDYAVLVLRRGDGPPAARLGPAAPAHRLIVMAEDEGQMRTAARAAGFPAAFTHDLAFLTGPPLDRLLAQKGRRAGPGGGRRLCPCCGGELGGTMCDLVRAAPVLRHWRATTQRAAVADSQASLTVRQCYQSQQDG